MKISQKYMHDRVVLLLLVANSLLTVLTIVTMVLRLQGANADDYIIQYRANLGLNAFKVGGIGSVLSFMVFAILVMAYHTVLSIRVFTIRRPLSIGILGLGTLLLTLTLIISNSLLLLAR